jgi:hypothetical protein
MRRRIEEARERIAQQVGTALDDRDIEDFERITRKILAAFDGAAQPSAKT